MSLPVSVLFIVGLVLDVIGFILHVVGMATPAWSSFQELEYGLFQYCIGSTCDTYTSDDKTSAIEASEAMAVIGVLCAVAAVILLIVHIVLVVMDKGVKMLPIVAGVLSIVAFVFIIIGVIIWGAKVQDDIEAAVFDARNLNYSLDLDYSFALSIVGSILLLVGGIILLVSELMMNGSVGAF